MPDSPGSPPGSARLTSLSYLPTHALPPLCTGPICCMKQPQNLVRSGLTKAQTADRQQTVNMCPSAIGCPRRRALPCDFGSSEIIYPGPVSLSGGWKRKLVLTRTVAVKADILLLLPPRTRTALRGWRPTGAHLDD
jgi:hypothetical protein